MAKAQELWKECATLCRDRRETVMLVESLSSLGTLQLLQMPAQLGERATMGMDPTDRTATMHAR